jgi:hypothetical protein
MPNKEIPMTTISTITTPRHSRIANIGLWCARLTLGVLTGAAAIMEASHLMHEAWAMVVGYAVDYPALLTQFKATMELLGALGIVPASVTGIASRLTRS